MMVNLSRRAFLKTSAAGAAAAYLVPYSATRAARAAMEPPGGRRPNILWLSAEDVSPTLGCYGDAYADTPNLDRFAAQGVRYANAFTHAPVCAPARSGIITGMYPDTIGTTWMRCKGVPPAEAKCFPEYLRAVGYYCTNNSKTDYQFSPPPAAWDESSRKAHWRNRPRKDQPFFAVFNFTVTHESSTRRWTPGRQKHDPAKAPLPPYYPDTPVVRQNIACYYDRLSELDGQIVQRLKELEDAGLADDTIVFFWGDHGWGLTRGKRWIYDSGIRVPLLVRVPAKWREWAGAGEAASVAPGTVETAFARFLDFAPTVLSLAGVPIPGHMQGRAFLGPQKGREPAYVFAARDRMDETYDCIRALRDKKFKYIRNFMPYLPRSQHINYMDQTPILQEMRRLYAAGELKPGPQMQFFEPTKPVHELYDITEDPHEVRNLAADPAHRSVVERMEAALYAKMKAIGDVGLIPECDFDAMKGGGKVEPPVCTVTGGGNGRPQTVQLTCPTLGASIVYELTGGAKKAARKNAAAWLVYSEPVAVAPGQHLRAKACRLGYADSGITTFAYGDAGQPPAQPGPDPTPWRTKINASGMIDRILDLKAFDGRWTEGVPAYRKALSDPAGPVRYWAVVGLHQAYPSDPPAEVLDEVRGLLKDEAASVPIAAAHALVDWGKTQEGLDRLVEALSAPGEKTRLLACHCLERLGEKARPVLARLEKAVKNQSGYPQRLLPRVVEALKKG